MERKFFPVPLSGLLIVEGIFLNPGLHVTDEDIDGLCTL